MLIAVELLSNILGDGSVGRIAEMVDFGLFWRIVRFPRLSRPTRGWLLIPVGRLGCCVVAELSRLLRWG